MKQYNQAVVFLQIVAITLNDLQKNGNLLLYICILNYNGQYFISFESFEAYMQIHSKPLIEDYKNKPLNLNMI